MVLDLFTWYVKHKRLHSPTRDHYKNKRLKAEDLNCIWFHESTAVSSDRSLRSTVTTESARIKENHGWKGRGFLVNFSAHSKLLGIFQRKVVPLWNLDFRAVNYTQHPCWGGLFSPVLLLLSCELFSHAEVFNPFPLHSASWAVKS